MTLMKTIDLGELVKARNSIKMLIHAAHAALHQAEEEAKRLNEQITASPVTAHLKIDIHRICLPESYKDFHKEPTIKKVVTRLDAQLWEFAVEACGFSSMMSAEARADWYGNTKPRIGEPTVPEFTADNLRSTIHEMDDGKEKMFNGSIVAIFRALSWNFKMNLPVKFGTKIKISGSGYRFGPISEKITESLRDLERVQLLLDGKPVPSFDHTVSELAFHGDIGEAFKYEDDLFHLQVYKNGNCDVHFKRPDLVEKMNSILAEESPRALPATYRKKR